MIITLHRPNLIAVLSECLFGICAHAGVNQYGNRIQIQRECAHIIMIVAFVIEPSFGCYKHSMFILHIAEFRFGIPSHVRHLMFRGRFGKIITAKQGLERTESIITHCSIRLSAIQ